MLNKESFKNLIANMRILMWGYIKRKWSILGFNIVVWLAIVSIDPLLGGIAIFFLTYTVLDDFYKFTFNVVEQSVVDQFWEDYDGFESMVEAMNNPTKTAVEETLKLWEKQNTQNNK